MTKNNDYISIPHCEDKKFTKYVRMDTTKYQIQHQIDNIKSALEVWEDRYKRDIENVDNILISYRTTDNNNEPGAGYMITAFDRLEPGFEIIIGVGDLKLVVQKVKRCNKCNYIRDLVRQGMCKECLNDHIK